ncbi:nitroreductase [Sphingomonas jejuensis]|uniref:Putative NAD(P)H nitroreductase n=1 Tax=Sphingomonas jejuensis TaxID=904715 RepID=A0ABX0XMX9_9SPHN|nr:nitroreductase [Sphingomonas jejuensis]NJC34096.1 nitroreductase [Sphingomonas jejuensis]
MFNDRTSATTLMASRRSGKPRDMVAPGPDDTQLARILAAATRVPDHGKLAPWRFLVVPQTARDALGERLAACLRADRPDVHAAELDAARDFARQAPALVVALFSPRDSAKIPAWEQELSAGAACMALLVAAHAEGFVGSWLTTWAAYSERVRDLFGQAPERIAGFMFIGSPARELSERPRPDPAQVIGVWQP